MVFIYYDIKCLLDEMRILDKSFLEPKQARQQPFRIILHTAYLLNRGFFFCWWWLFCRLRNLFNFCLVRVFLNLQARAGRDKVEMVPPFPVLNQDQRQAMQ